MLRRALLVGSVALGAGLGLVQFASMAIYGDLAQPPAIPAVLSPRAGLALAAPLGNPRTPVFLRVAYAQALLHRGAVRAAAAITAGLPDDSDAADLRGELAQQRGDAATALTQFARAGDLERAQELIDARASAGGIALAAQYEHVLVDALDGPGQAAVRARALWRLGQLTQVQAQGDPGRRNALERAALELYDRALTIAPNEETYLLAAGQQALSIGDKVRAQRYYLRALDVVPDSVDARAGLVRART